MALLRKLDSLSLEAFLQQVEAQVKPLGAPVSVRRKLPPERRSLTHKFSIAGHECYIHIGMYEDSSPGEIFIHMAKEGSTISGLMDAFGISISLALQHGVPLRLLIDKFVHTRFEPSGWTGNPEIPQAMSIMDYIFRWLQLRFSPAERPGPALHGGADEKGQVPPARPRRQETDAPTCNECGTIMVRSGSCCLCLNCGATNGCS
jgi:ribonucleoside-diphosphate reductase alpha chain